MSQVHRVINLREPFKIFSMTLHQIGWLSIGVVVAFGVGSRVPGDLETRQCACGNMAGHSRGQFINRGWRIFRAETDGLVA